MPRWWDDWLLPRTMDLILADRLAGPWRAPVCAGARGRVLELGFGTGRSLRFYDPCVVDEVLVVEPSDTGWDLSRGRRAAYRGFVTRVAPDAARLPLDDASVDTVVSHWTLCTIPDVRSALAEVSRVLHPGGQFRFVEHTVAPEAWVASVQHAIQPVWGAIGGGCHLTRDITGLLGEAGLRVRLDRTGYGGSGLAKVPTWFVTGVATHAD